jgi:hypothetical protein
MKIKKILYLSLILLLSYSCTSKREGIYIADLPKYENEEGYKSLYIVDTIKIKEPIRVFTKKGYQFIMEKKVFESYNGKEDFFFNHSGIFLMETDLPMALPSSIFSKYAHGSDCLEYAVLSSKKKKGINNIYSFRKSPNYFLIILIRGDYYNEVYTGIDGPPTLNIKINKLPYYRVAIPCCF